MSLTLKMAHFSVLPLEMSSVGLKIVDYVQQFNFSNVFYSRNGLLQYTSIGDKFSRFGKLLIMSSNLTFQMSLTLKLAHFNVLP